MANQKKQAVEATFTEEMVARVNQEGDHHEVLLRGLKSNSNLSFRNTHGAKGFKNGSIYTVTFTENLPEPEAEETANA